MNSTNIGPRVGGAYLVTEDARNVLRAFFGRVHEQVNGRDPITTFGPTSRRFQRDIYDANGDGIFETEIITPAATAAINALAFDPDLHQPYRRRVRGGLCEAVPRPDQPGSVASTAATSRMPTPRSTSTASIRAARTSRSAASAASIPTRGMIMQQTNATWSKVVVTNLEAILAKNLSHNFQVMATPDAAVAAPRRHVESDRPGAVHPARRVPEQPRSVAASVRQRRRQQPRWRRRRVWRRLPAVLGAARGAVLRAVGGPGGGQLRHSGRRLSRPGRRAECGRRSDLRARAVRLANGTTQPNPLATSWRFAYGTRSDGQMLNETTRYLQLNLGRTFKFGRQSVDAGLGIFNVFNTGAHTQWNTGANRLNNAAVSVAVQPPPAARVPDHVGVQVLRDWVRSPGEASSRLSGNERRNECVHAIAASGRRVALWCRSLAARPCAASAAASAAEVYSRLHWRHIGPEGNRFSAVAGVPGDPHVYYVGAASGGISKTTDGGVNWQPIFDDQPVQSIGSLAVAPSDPNTVWAGTGEGKIRSHISVGQGIYKSTDAGRTWALMGLEQTGRIPPTRDRSARTRTSCSPARWATPTVRSPSAACSAPPTAARPGTGAVRRREHRLLGPRDGSEEPARAVRRHVAVRDPDVGPRERRPGQRAVRLARRRRDLEEADGQRPADAGRSARWRSRSRRPIPTASTR